MEKVEPIRSREALEEMKNFFRKRNYRDYLLFVFGCNTALRVSDLVKLRVKDVRVSSGEIQTIKTHVFLREEKTNKSTRLRLPEGLREELAQYVAGMHPDQPLFPSRKTGEPISTIQAWRIMNYAAKHLGLEKIGTHSMRKSFAYHAYQQTKDIAVVQHMLNHSSPSITRRYLGIDDDEVESALGDFEL